MLAGTEELGDYADDLTAVIEHRRCNRAHESDGAAAKDQADAVLGHDPAEPARRFHKAWIGPRPGAAIDADRVDFTHCRDLAVSSGKVKPLLNSAGSAKFIGRPPLPPRARHQRMNGGRKHPI